MLILATDNQNPRSIQEKLEGYGARARNTMNNHSEQFGFFAAAAVLVLAVKDDMSDRSGKVAAAFALVYSVMRLLHLVFYVLDWAAARSSVFGVGLLCLVGLYAIALAATAHEQ
jgi:uncharacterized MAPEG superfamily protein